MPDFGYKLQKDRQIDFDANDRSFLKKVTVIEPTFKLCIACGTCAATCSTSQFTDFSLRRVITALKRGENKGIAEEINKCMLCGKCQMICPRGISTRKLVVAVRKVFADDQPVNQKKTGANYFKKEDSI